MARDISNTDFSRNSTAAAATGRSLKSPSLTILFAVWASTFSLVNPVLKLFWVKDTLDKHNGFLSDAKDALKSTNIFQRTTSFLGFSPADRVKEADRDLQNIEASMMRLKKLHDKITMSRFYNLALTAPVYRLPAEILHGIFKDALPEFGHLCGTSRSNYPQLHSSVLTLRMVCSDWNSVVASNPSFFTHIGIGAFTRPVPDGPWKQKRLSWPWSYFNASTFNFESCQSGDDNECVPRRFGPAKHYHINVPAAAALYAKNARDLALEVDLRTLSSEVVVNTVVGLSGTQNRWRILYLDVLDWETSDALDCLSDGLDRVLFPFTAAENENMDEAADRWEEIRVMEEKGIARPNAFLALSIVYIRSGYTRRISRLEAPPFLANLPRLRHLSIDDAIKWDTKYAAMIAWSSLLTLELINIVGPEDTEFILGKVTTVETLIIRNSLRTDLNYSSLAPTVDVNSVKFLTYINPYDDYLDFFRIFLFENLVSLTLEVDDLYSSLAWLTTKSAERVIRQAVMLNGSKNCWSRLEQLQLLHLETDDLQVVRDDFETYSLRTSLRNKLNDLELVSGAEDSVPVAERFFVASSARTA